MASSSLLTITTGDDADLAFQFSNESTAINLTGGTVYFTAKERVDEDEEDAAAVLRADSECGLIEIVDAAFGSVLVHLPRWQTKRLESGKTYVWDCVVRDAQGAVKTVAFGTIEVRARVTLRGASTAIFLRADSNLADLNDMALARKNLGAASARWIAISEDGSSAHGGDRIRANTSAGAFAILLPGSPNDGEMVEVLDAAGSWSEKALTINGGAHLIEGDATLVCDVADAHLWLVFEAASGGWAVYQ